MHFISIKNKLALLCWQDRRLDLSKYTKFEKYVLSILNIPIYFFFTDEDFKDTLHITILHTYIVHSSEIEVTAWRMEIEPIPLVIQSTKNIYSDFI